MEMKKYKLGDIAKTSSGGTPKSTIAEYYEGGNIPWINSGELGNPFITSTNNFITKKGYDNSSAKLFPPQTVLLAMYGATAGKVSLLEIEACTNQAICAIMPNKDILLPIYLKYKLDTMYNYLVRLSTGSARDNLSQDGIKAIELSIPSLSVQQKIATVLSTLDKRIENLRAQNRVLEQTAKTIYDYTFLQCAGHQTTYNKTLNRNIPTNWEVKKLGDLVEINDSSIRKNEFEYILYLETSGIVENKIEEISSLKSSDAPSRAKRKVKDRTIVYSTVRPEQRHFGILLNPPSNLIVSTGFVTIDSKKDVGDVSFFLYSFLSQDSTIQYLDTIAANSVSSYPSINPSDIENMFVACPDSKTLEKFNMNVTPLFQKQLVNTKQIEALTTQRNTLLPLLMTGQITIK